jgi:hypothetical protein
MPGPRLLLALGTALKYALAERTGRCQALASSARGSPRSLSGGTLGWPGCAGWSIRSRGRARSCWSPVRPGWARPCCWPTPPAGPGWRACGCCGSPAGNRSPGSRSPGCISCCGRCWRPPPACPAGRAGKWCSIIPFRYPPATATSNPFTELARTLTSTSPSPGSGTGRSCRLGGAPKSSIAMAFTACSFLLTRDGSQHRTLFRSLPAATARAMSALVMFPTGRRGAGVGGAVQAAEGICHRCRVSRPGAAAGSGGGRLRVIRLPAATAASAAMTAQ